MSQTYHTRNPDVSRTHLGHSSSAPRYMGTLRLLHSPVSSSLLAVKLVVIRGKVKIGVAPHSGLVGPSGALGLVLQLLLAHHGLYPFPSTSTYLPRHCWINHQALLQHQQQQLLNAGSLLDVR